MSGRNAQGIIQTYAVKANISLMVMANAQVEKDIAFIHDAKNERQKLNLFKKVNDGDIRVLIGSTGKMGAGVNVQERAAALHHLARCDYAQCQGPLAKDSGSCLRSPTYPGGRVGGGVGTQGREFRDSTWRGCRYHRPKRSGENHLIKNFIPYHQTDRRRRGR